MMDCTTLFKTQKSVSSLPIYKKNSPIEIQPSLINSLNKSLDLTSMPLLFLLSNWSLHNHPQFRFPKCPLTKLVNSSITLASIFHLVTVLEMPYYLPYTINQALIYTNGARKLLQWRHVVLDIETPQTLLVSPKSVSDTSSMCRHWKIKFKILRHFIDTCVTLLEPSGHVLYDKSLHSNNVVFSS